MITEHASVVLTENIPASGLEAGDVGVVVHIHREGKAYEVEFLSLDGGTLTIETRRSKLDRYEKPEAGIFPMFVSFWLPDLAQSWQP